MNEIEQLKRYVVQSKDLSEPFNYFFDLTDHTDTFSKIKSHRTVKNIHQHTELMAVVQVVQKVTNERLGKTVKQLIPIFHEIPESCFFHGVCLSVDLVMPLTVIYFSDIKTGLFATAAGTTDMIRFSLMKASDQKENH
jgi:hypothetical protein